MEFLRHMRAIRASSLTATQRLVLINLADIASDDGRCWAAQSTLAEACGLTDRAVRGALAALEEVGVISSAGWYNRCVVWRLDLTRIPARPRNDVPTSEDDPGTTFRRTRNDVPSYPERRSDNPTHDPTYDPTHPSPNPRPEGAGAPPLTPGAVWVRDRLLTSLLEVAEAGGDVEARLAEYERADTTSVDQIKAYLAGTSAKTLDGGTVRRRPERGIPEGLRRRDHVAAMRAAVAAWPEISSQRRDATLLRPLNVGPPSTADPPRADPAG